MHIVFGLIRCRVSALISFVNTDPPSPSPLLNFSLLQKHILILAVIVIFIFAMVASLDGKWFTGGADITCDLADTLLITNFGRSIDATLGQNGWDSDKVAGIALELTNDNRGVSRAQFFLRGPLSKEPGLFQAAKLWDTGSKSVVVSISFPHGGAFDFSGCSLASDYLPAEEVKLSCSKDGQPILPTDWPAHGVGNFCLRAIAHLDRASNGRVGPRVKFTVLFFPHTRDQLAEMSDAMQGAGWPGIKVLEGHAALFPTAPAGNWGCPLYPLIGPGADFQSVRVLPSGAELRHVISKIMGTARLPTACGSVGAYLKKVKKLVDQEEDYEDREPAIVWPASQQPQTRQGKIISKLSLGTQPPHPPTPPPPPPTLYHELSEARCYG